MFLIIFLCLLLSSIKEEPADGTNIDTLEHQLSPTPMYKSSLIGSIRVKEEPKENYSGAVSHPDVSPEYNSPVKAELNSDVEKEPNLHIGLLYPMINIKEEPEDETRIEIRKSSPALCLGSVSIIQETVDNCRGVTSCADVSSEYILPVEIELTRDGGNVPNVDFGLLHPAASSRPRKKGKTSSERGKEFRERQRLLLTADPPAITESALYSHLFKPPRKIPKTSVERQRDYRLRMKKLREEQNVHKEKPPKKPRAEYQREYRLRKKLQLLNENNPN